MVFKNFRVQVTIRVLLLAVALFLMSWSLVNEYYLRATYSAIASVIVLIEFIWFVDRFNRDVKSFMVSLLQRDFTTHFQSRGKSKSFDELYDALNRISDVFKIISAEKEAQFRFLEMLVEHLRVGILTVDETGKINLVNQALKTMLQKDVLFSLKSLETFNASLAVTLREIRSGETRLLKLRVNNELLQLSIHASEFLLENKYHKLISLQNIRNELDAREMEAWQKLIRVLTHEIMNSVSPIISLSETMHRLIEEHKEALQHQNAELFNTLDKGLEAINIRGEGLFHFTQSYRKLTGIPKVSLKETNTKALIDRVTVLLESKLHEKGIVLKVSGEQVPITVDPQLMEHVLINLFANAVDALSDTNSPQISIWVDHDPKGNVLIHVGDNGEGIDEITSENIFVPFFTTRRTGSGIGLALSKQILQLHHGDIRFTSEKGKGTEFVIVL